MNKKAKIIITIGDPAGIGPEITAKALMSRQIKKDSRFIIIGDLKAFYQKKLSLPKSVQFIDLNNIKEKIKFGKIKAEYGQASIEYINKAVQLLKHKEGDCLVTAPICKESVNRAGYNISGHTEYLARLCHKKEDSIIMMLIRNDFRVVLVTRHIKLEDVPSKIKKDRIKKTIRLTFKSLQDYFKIKSPKIAICGLNPHASDGGFIGREDTAIIKPAIRQIQLAGVYGPFAADTLFSKQNLNRFDCFIAMYHDQGLIPIKYSGLQEVVNCTFGLPFIRTSPGHGTAFDIAARKIASAQSMISAIQLACQFFKNKLKNYK